MNTRDPNRLYADDELAPVDIGRSMSTDVIVELRAWATKQAEHYGQIAYAWACHSDRSETWTLIYAIKAWQYARLAQDAARILEELRKEEPWQTHTPVA